jgi:hypothetical protein
MRGRTIRLALGLLIACGASTAQSQSSTEAPIAQIVGVVGDTLTVFAEPRGKAKQVIRATDLTFPIPVYKQESNMRVKIGLPPDGRRGWVDKTAVRVQEQAKGAPPCDAPPSKHVAAAATRGLDPGCRR